MAEDLFDYFTGNAPKKVEPIEDDDFDNFAPPQDLGTNQASDACEQVDAPASTNDLGAADVSIKAGLKSEDTAPIVEQPSSAKKGDSHWDFLAGILGIKREPASPSPERAKQPSPAPTPAASQKEAKPLPPPVAAKPVEPIKTAERPAAKTDSPFDFFGFDPIPPAKEEVALKSMFQPSQDPNVFDVEPNAKSSLNDLDDQDELDSEFDAELDDQEGEYLEFEIEELDESPYRDGEEENFGRRRRRSGESRDARDEGFQADSPNRSRRRDHDRDDDSSGQQGRRPRDADRQRQRSSTEEFNDGVSASNQASADDETATTGRSRRRRRGRGRGRNRDKEQLKPDADLAANDRSDFIDEEVEFVDEIGWSQPPTKRPEKAPSRDEVSKRTGQRDDFSHHEGEIDDLESHDDAESPADQASTGRRRSRRRGGRSRRGKPAEGSRSNDSHNLDSAHDDGFSDSFDDDAYDSANRSRSSQRAQHSDRMEHEEDDDGGRGNKFPSWAEAISVLVDANIKNHGQSSNRGRGRGGNGGGRGGRGRSR